MSSNKKPSRKKGRMDFVVEKIEPILGEENLFRVVMRPDPRIWTIVKEKGKEAYYNATDKVLIPMEEFKKAIKTMSGIPVVASSVRVEGFEDYVLKSKKRIKKDIQEEITN